MQYEIEINGRLRQVTVHRADGRFEVTVDGKRWTVDAASVDNHTWSLLISGEVRQPTKIRLKPDPSSTPAASSANVGSGFGRTESFEVTLAPDTAPGSLIARINDAAVAVAVNGRRRWGRRDGGPQTGSGGPERLLAPMPGKIVRVLVKTGEAVRARQPVVVIEAMKMENELRASADGTVAEMHVRDGQSVDAGTLLAVIHR